MSLTSSNLFASIIDQKLGFSFGKPKRVDEKSLTVVLPILRERSLNRQYITFPETEKVLVFDTGKIDQMEVDNKCDDHVFIRSGTLFKGATQERALQRSAIVFAGKKATLEVRCVHASREINPSASVKNGGLTPLDLDQANYSHGYSPKDQHTTWANVYKSTSNMSALYGGGGGSSMSAGMSREFHGTVWGGSNAPNVHGANYFSAPTGSDDLAKHLDAFSVNFEEILSKIKRDEGQSGLALITESGVQTIETFDHADSWKAIHEAAVKRMGTALVTEDKESVFEFKPENAHKMVNRVLAMDFARKNIFKHRPSNGEPSVEITGLTAPGYVGELVEVNDQVMHLTILKRTD